MLAEPGRGWTLDELAKRASTSRATLVRLFRNAVRVAPLAFLTELRLSLARHRMLATSTPLAVIAEEVGYQSETAFSRAYRRRFGVAPGADRRGEIGNP
jgi:AraC family transcriptional activator of mtrCDE